jgi:hypothetical protein
MLAFPTMWIVAIGVRYLGNHTHLPIKVRKTQ